MGQWSFWFHTERIFLHYYVTISFNIRFLLHVVYGTCSYSAYGHTLIIGVEWRGAFSALLGWLAGGSVCRLVVGWFVDYLNVSIITNVMWASGWQSAVSHVFFS